MDAKELPTKLSKVQRSRERREMAQVLNFDNEHSNRLNSKKCTGTQTWACLTFFAETKVFTEVLILIRC